MRTSSSCLLGAVLISTLGLGVGFQNTATAAEAELIRIYPVPRETKGETIAHKVTDIQIVPKAINIKENTIVIWLNAATLEVKVVFQEGDACKDLVTNPKDFMLDENHCFVTSYLPWGGTSSLIFPRAGKFEYTVEAKDGKIKSKGEIVVSK